MDWGTVRRVNARGDAESQTTQLKARFPEVESAYVPSGALPASALLWLAIGGALAVPVSAMVGTILGGITVVLAALMGLVIALVAACGFVVCFTIVIELVIVVGGAAITFGGAGLAVGFLVAWLAGRMGKNRNAWAAALVASSATFVGVLVLFALPQVALLFVGPPDPTSDFAISTIVHTIADLGWVQITVGVLGALVAMAAAGLIAYGEVGLQKFCERCNEHMDDMLLWGTSFEHAAILVERSRANDYASIASVLAQEQGIDVETHLHACPRCGVGFLESQAHVRAQWPGKDGDEDDHWQWLFLSTSLIEQDTRQLKACARPEEA